MKIDGRWGPMVMGIALSAALGCDSAPIGGDEGPGARQVRRVSAGAATADEPPTSDGAPQPPPASAHDSSAAAPGPVQPRTDPASEHSVGASASGSSEAAIAAAPDASSATTDEGGTPSPPAPSEPSPATVLAAELQEEDVEASGSPSSSADPDEAPPRADLPPFRIAIIGSSTAAGVGASNEDKAWASALYEDLEAIALGPVELENLAVGGYTALDLQSGSESDGNVDDAIALAPDLLIVGLAGSNDIAPDMDTETFIGQLESVRRAAEGAGIPTFFMETLPKNLSAVDRELLQGWGRAMREAFGSCWVPEREAPYDACFMEVFEPLADAELGLAPEFDSGDGSHLNDLGHLILARFASASVVPYMCQHVACISSELEP